MGRELVMVDVYTVADVRAEINSYLSGKVDRKQLTEWLTPLVWQEEGDVEALDLGWGIALLLMEAGRGDLTEEELRAGLRSLVDESVPA